MNPQDLNAILKSVHSRILNLQRFIAREIPCTIIEWFPSLSHYSSFQGLSLRKASNSLPRS